MKKKALSAAIASALAVPMAAQAVNIELTGQVNKAYMLSDNGESSDAQVVDNDASSTRFRFRGSEDIGNGVKAGIYWEVQHQSNPSNRLNIKNSPADIGDGATDTPQVGFSERHAEVFFETGFGKVSLGQGDGAGNGGTERDLSGTTVVALASRVFMGGGIEYDCGGPETQGNGGGNCGFVVRDTWDNYDAFSRYDRVRYDTPTIGPGIVLSANSGNRNVYEVAASLRSSLGGGKIDGAIFYANGQNRLGREIIGGSLSYLFGTGTSLTGHYADVDFTTDGTRTARGDDARSWGLKLGQKWGMHNFAIDYSFGEDTAAVRVPGTLNQFNTDDTQTYGISWVYELPGPKVDIYAGYRRWDTDLKSVNGRGADEIDVVMIGSRVKF